MERVELHWLGNAPKKGSGVTWGVPWPRGSLSKQLYLGLEDENGMDLPLVSWPTAYWPDGSIKWTAHATSFEDGYEIPKVLFINERHPDNLNYPDAIAIKEFEEHIEVSTGNMICDIAKSGENIIRFIQCGGTLACSGSHLVCINENTDVTSGRRVLTEESFDGEIDSAYIEQYNAMRCVIRVNGRHANKGYPIRKWLPFILRLYFYAGQCSIRFVYTILYDGNPYSDFIKGLGIAFTVPMSGPLYNRYVRLAGDTGLFAESPKGLMTIRTKGKYDELYKEQTGGIPVSFDEKEDRMFLDLLSDSAVWDSFKIVQNSSCFYEITKKTAENCSFIKAASGNKAKGMGYIGCQTNSLCIAIKDFWQKYPSAIDMSGLSSDEAEAIVWFWPPYDQPMDLRHYDTKTHLVSSYEGFTELRSTPYGIANTSEFSIWCYDKPLNNDEIAELSNYYENTNLLVCKPEWYKRCGVFGKWSIKDTSTPEKKFVEEQLDELIEFYKGEIDRRDWYGFWSYGDVMHSYDSVRHTWRYDIGGCAWQNTELVPNMWLWHMFLRSGRDDIFRIAEAMARHTSEVDVYHLGEYAGLGSRHNVVHWGCGCKEARISMAGLHRYYYYLTGDERIGDIMDEVKDVDYAVGRLDPMRAYYPPDPHFKTHVRIGPDVMAFCSNWFTRWERYEDNVYKEKLFKCLDFFKKHPYTFVSSGVYGYDPEKTQLYEFQLLGGDHFMFCFGSQIVWMEIFEAIGDQQLNELLMDLGQYYTPFIEGKEEKLKEWGVPNVKFDLSVYSSGLAAYAARYRGVDKLAHAVWDILLENSERSWVKLPVKSQEVVCWQYVKPIIEIPWISTNAVSQWSLNTIICLEFIGDKIPKGYTS